MNTPKLNFYSLFEDSSGLKGGSSQLLHTLFDNGNQQADSPQVASAAFRDTESNSDSLHSSEPGDNLFDFGSEVLTSDYKINAFPDVVQNTPNSDMLYPMPNIKTSNCNGSCCSSISYVPMDVSTLPSYASSSSGSGSPNISPNNTIKSSSHSSTKYISYNELQEMPEPDRFQASIRAFLPKSPKRGDWPRYLPSVSKPWSSKQIMDNTKKVNHQNQIKFRPPTFNNMKTKSRACRFCQNNGEPYEIYASHETKMPDGIVVCPILRKHVCDICGATGDYAHTRRYCPENKEKEKNRPVYRRLTNGFITKNHNHK